MPVEVRDPVHGSILVDDAETAIIDHPLFQRLRRIRQLGFGDLAFPGATHTRYLHSLGAMELAGQAFDSMFKDLPLGGRERKQALRCALRLGALLHDVGHAPMSHASEFAMPEVDALGLPPRPGGSARRATHEDYTLKILLDSPLTRTIEKGFGFRASSVASLIDRDLVPDDDFFHVDGVDYRILLSQLVSSELDMDRMDYLTRDSYFTGVQYGSFDLRWLVTHLSFHVSGTKAHLALSQKAIYAFDHFLIARYHMFLMVYFHYRCVAYEEMLRRFLGSSDSGYVIPSDIEAYADCDDFHLMSHLRTSHSDWARRIIHNDEYKLLAERHGEESELESLASLVETLQGGEVPHLFVRSSSALSKYFDPGKGKGSGSEPIYVLETPMRGDPTVARPLEASTDLFRRYAGKKHLARVYVPRERMEEARGLGK